MIAEGGDGVEGDPDITAASGRRARHGQGGIIHNGEPGNTLTPIGLAVDVVDGSVDTVDVESWVASMRPSADALNAGAAFIGSDELEANANMLRFIGEFSASQTLGEKAGACPGADAATDAAWTYLLDNANQLSTLPAGAVVDAPPERKDEVEHLLTWLVSPVGLPYLRAFACELRRATTASPHAAVTDDVTDASPVNWSACWAWCAHHSTTLTGWTRALTPYLWPAWQGPSHRGGALQQGACGWPHTRLCGIYADPMRPPGAVAGDSLPYRSAHRLLSAQLWQLVQHSPVHALVLRRMHEDMDGGTQERHVPGVQDQDQVRAGACAANRT